MLFTYVHPFKGGVAVVSKSGLYGVIDKKGNYVVEPKYEFIGAFNCERAIIETKRPKEDDGIMKTDYHRLQGVIDIYGDVVVEPSSTILDPSGYADDMLGFTSEGKKGFLDKNGKVVIPAVYDKTMVFSEGLCPVMQVIKKKVPNPTLKRGWSHRTFKKWGAIDKKGNVVIPFIFNYMMIFSDGFAPARVDEGWTYIDHSGNIVGEGLV